MRKAFQRRIRSIVKYWQFLPIGSLVLFYQSAKGQTAPKDSLRVVRSAEVLVSGDSSSIGAGKLIREVSTQSIRILTGEPNISEALPEISSDIDVRHYSSLGGVAFTSFHGLPAEYTVVFRDGVRITNEQNSLTDVGRMSSTALSEIRLLSPGAAIALGGDAIGAAIDLRSRHAMRDQYEVGASALAYQTGANPSEFDYHASLDQRFSRSLGVAATFSNEHSDGKFPIDASGVLRENNDALIQDASLVADLALGGDTNSDGALSLIADYTKADRGAPGNALIEGRGASSFNAHQHDEDLFAALKWTTGDQEAWHSNAAVSFQSQFETYANPDIVTNAIPLSDHYLNHIYAGDYQLSGAVGEAWKLFTGLSGSYSQLFSNENFSSPHDSLISRKKADLFGALEWRVMNDVVVVGGLRVDVADQLRPQYLPQLSAVIHPTSDFELGVALGLGYHAPTLNELYWKEGGNPNLHEERARSAELYSEWRLPVIATLQTSLGASFIYTNVRDQILWLPNPTIYSPINIQSSENGSLEVHAHAAWPIAGTLLLSLFESYSFLSAVNRTDDPIVFGKEIPFSTPTSSLFTATLGDLSLGSLAFIARYRGHRYTNLGNTESGKLQPVTTFDITASTRAITIAPQFFITLQLAMRNITDQHYTEQPNYPLPGRNLRLSATIGSQSFNRQP